MAMNQKKPPTRHTCYDTDGQRAWMRTRGMRQIHTGHPCWRRVTTGRCRLLCFIDEAGGPGADHLELYRTQGGIYALVSHPYLDGACVGVWSAVQQWAATHALHVTRDEVTSWYFPGRTTLIVYRTLAACTQRDPDALNKGPRRKAYDKHPLVPQPVPGRYPAV